MSARRLLLASLLLFLAAAPARGGGPISDPSVWNERGLRAYREGDYPRAILCFRTASEGLPGDATIRFNLATAHAREAIRVSREDRPGGYAEALREATRAIEIDGSVPFFYKVIGFVHQENGAYDEARKAYREAVRLDPGDADAWKRNGDAAYHLDLREEAMLCWEKAIRLDPARIELASRIDKAGREDEIEGGYREAKSRHFRLAYDPHVPGARALVGEMLDALEDARRTVLRELDRPGGGTVAGVAYPAEDFRRVLSGHGWARGLYDGKIRVPFPESGEVDEAFRQTALHEYTHVVVFEWTGNRCPAWLNEGLAQHLAGEWSPARSRAAARLAARGSLLPLETIGDSFLELPESLVQAAYLESYLVVARMREGYTGRHMTRLLDRIAEGISPREAVREVYHRTYEELLEEAFAPLLAAAPAR